MNESKYLIERRGRMLGIKPPEEKKPKPIAPFSKKRAKKQAQYRKIVDKMLKENDRCEVRSPVCTGKAQGMQHIEKRSEKNLLNTKKLLRSCNSCNTWIEENPVEAIAMGVSESKFKLK